MEKGNIYKVIVIGLIVAIFIGEYALNILVKRGSNTISGGEIYKGWIYGNFRITDYNLNLISNDVIDDSDIKGMPGIVKVISLSNQTLIKVNDSSLIPSIFSKMNSLGHPIAAKATLQPEGSILLEDGKTVNLTQSIQSYIPPVAPVGGIIYGKAYVYLRGDNLLGIGGFSILINKKNVSFKAKIVNITNPIYTYAVDFSNRGSIEKLQQFIDLHCNDSNESMEAIYLCNIRYEINNVIYPKFVVGVSDLPYVKYVGDSYVIVDSDMVNKSRIINDFGNDTVFSYSYIYSPVDISDLLSKLNISVDNVERDSTYFLSPEDDRYVFTNNTVIYETSDTFNVNDTVMVNGEATISGNVVMGIDVKSLSNLD